MNKNVNIYETSYRNSFHRNLKDMKIAIWGLGALYKLHKCFLEKNYKIVAVYDSDAEKVQGYDIDCVEVCDNFSDLKKYADIIVITVQNQKARESIVEKISKEDMKFTFIEDVINSYKRESVLDEEAYNEDEVPYTDDSLMKAYIGILMPEYVCNLKCEYCYITQHNEKHHYVTDITKHIPYISNAVSYKNIGGAALIGLCGTGETFLQEGFVELCISLLKQGHYLHIVTNGLVTPRIKELIETAGIYASHVFFKMSFHYSELVRLNLLETFVETIKFVETSRASYSIELMPHDELVPCIDEIKDFCISNFGALPQLTVGRDDNNNFKLLSEMNLNEYYSVWKQFDSPLFEYKMSMFKIGGCKCMAGKFGINIDLESGNISRCTVVGESVGNIYDDGKVILSYEEIGDKCPLDYCYNCHVYGPLGIMLKDREIPTYLEMRDRKMTNGKNWVKGPMAKFLKQKIYDNYI